MIEDISRPAAVVSSAGLVLSTNPAAKALAGTWPHLLEGGRLWPDRPGSPLGHVFGDQGPVAALRSMRPFPLHMTTTGDMLFVQPLSTVETHRETSFRVLIIPLSRRPLGDVTVLQLLGLTRAEARLAALVAAGQTVASAATELGVRESTARSTLKVVYRKLGARKQSELARLVAYIEALS